MSSILHLDKVLVRYFMLTVLVLVCVCVLCVFIAAQCPLKELFIVLGLSTDTGEVKSTFPLAIPHSPQQVLV